MMIVEEARHQRKTSVMMVEVKAPRHSEKDLGDDG